MKILQFITLIILFGLSSITIACGEMQEGKRIKPVFPIVGMSYSELSEAFVAIEKIIGNERIINISLHNSECLYVKTGKVLSKLKGSGKSYIFQKIKGSWELINESNWLS